MAQRENLVLPVKAKWSEADTLCISILQGYLPFPRLPFQWCYNMHYGQICFRLQYLIPLIRFKESSKIEDTRGSAEWKKAYKETGSCGWLWCLLSYALKRKWREGHFELLGWKVVHSWRFQLHPCIMDWVSNHYNIIAIHKPTLEVTVCPASPLWASGVWGLHRSMRTEKYQVVRFWLPPPECLQAPSRGHTPPWLKTHP